MDSPCELFGYIRWFKSDGSVDAIYTKDSLDHLGQLAHIIGRSEPGQNRGIVAQCRNIDGSTPAPLAIKWHRLVIAGLPAYKAWISSKADSFSSYSLEHAIGSLLLFTCHNHRSSIPPISIEEATTVTEENTPPKREGLSFERAIAELASTNLKIMRASKEDDFYLSITGELGTTGTLQCFRRNPCTGIWSQAYNWRLERPDYLAQDWMVREVQ